MSKIDNLKIYKSMYVSMPYFLYHYIGYNEENIYKMTHKDIKELFPTLRRSSITDVCKNPRIIYEGNVILVKDRRGLVVPYYNPLDKNSVFSCMDDIVSKEKDNKEYDILDIKKLTNYELKKEYGLQKKSHNFGRFKMVRTIKKELDNRGIKGHGRKRVLIEKLKGEIDYD